MPKNKETSTRGAGKGQKLLSGTRNQLVKDLKRVHKLFPNTQPDRDFYRQHGKYADAAWKAHFPRFKGFVGAAGVTPVAAVCWHLDQAAELLKRHGSDLSLPEFEMVVKKLKPLADNPTNISEEELREIDEILAEIAEEQRIEAEERKS